MVYTLGRIELQGKTELPVKSSWWNRFLGHFRGRICKVAENDGRHSWQNRAAGKDLSCRERPLGGIAFWGFFVVLHSSEMSGQANSGGSDDGRSDDEFKFNTTFDTVVWIQFVALVVAGLSLGLQYLTYLDEYESKKLAKESLMQGENL